MKRNFKENIYNYLFDRNNFKFLLNLFSGKWEQEYNLDLLKKLKCLLQLTHRPPHIQPINNIIEETKWINNFSSVLVWIDLNCVCWRFVEEANYILDMIKNVCLFVVVWRVRLKFYFYWLFIQIFLFVSGIKYYVGFSLCVYFFPLIYLIQAVTTDNFRILFNNMLNVIWIFFFKCFEYFL